MALVAANEGELVLLDTMLDAINVKLHLFKVDVTPDAASTVASFTESDFTDYAAKDLTGTSWNASTTVSGKGSATYADQTWTAGSAQTVYGYYVTTYDNATLLWAEKFDTSRSLGIGDSLTISPKLTLNSEN